MCSPQLAAQMVEVGRSRCRYGARDVFGEHWPSPGGRPAQRIPVPGNDSGIDKANRFRLIREGPFAGPRFILGIDLAGSVPFRIPQTSLSAELPTRGCALDCDSRLALFRY